MIPGVNGRPTTLLSSSCFNKGITNPSGDGWVKGYLENDCTLRRKKQLITKRQCLKYT